MVERVFFGKIAFTPTLINICRVDFIKLKFMTNLLKCLTLNLTLIRVQVPSKNNK